MNDNIRRWRASCAVAVSAALVGMGIGTAPNASGASVTEDFTGLSAGPVAGQSDSVGAWTDGNSQVVSSPGGADGHGQVLEVDDSEGAFQLATPFTTPVQVFQFDLWQNTDQRRTLFMDQTGSGAHGAAPDGPWYIFGSNGLSNRVPDNITWWDPGAFGGFGGLTLGTPFDYAANAWQHVVVLQNIATSTYSLFVDGKLVEGDIPFRSQLSDFGGFDFSIWFGTPDNAYLDNLNVNDGLGVWNSDVDNQNWSEAGNWLGNVPEGIDAIANFSGKSITADRTVSVDGAHTVGSLYFNNAPNNFTLGGSGSLTLDVSAGHASIAAASGNQTISVPVLLNKDTDIGIGDNATLTISGAVSGDAIFKTGHGVLALSGPNTYHGSTTINAGTVAVASGGALGDASATNTLILQGGALQATGAVTSPASRGVQIGAAGGTIDTNSNSVTINGVISGSGAFSKNGDGVLTLGGSNTFTGAMTIRGGAVAVSSDSNLGDPAATLNFNGGTLLTTAAITSSRTFRVRAPNGGTIDTGAFNSTIGRITGGATGGTLNKAGAGKLTTDGIDTDGLNVTAGTFAVSSGRAAAKTSILRSTLSVSGGAIDLNDNDLVLDYSGGADAGRLSSIASMISSAYSGGNWNGNGLTSSLASSTALNPTALGFGEASATGIANFDGIATDADMVLVRYTYSGDANLDGTVNALDFNAIASNFGASGSVWTQGDANYDGTVGTSDFTLLAKNFGQTLASPAASLAGSVVPEPTGLACIALGAAALLRRRRQLI